MNLKKGGGGGERESTDRLRDPWLCLVVERYGIDDRIYSEGREEDFN
jgi:hypothetical protein